MSTKPHLTVISTVARQLRNDLQFRATVDEAIEDLEGQLSRKKDELLSLKERIKGAEDWLRKFAPQELHAAHEHETSRARAAANYTN